MIRKVIAAGAGFAERLPFPARTASRSARAAAGASHLCRRRWIAWALLASIALASTAWAQGPGGQGGGRGGMGDRRPDAARRASVPDAPLNPGALVQKQLDQLEDDLKPTSAQSAAWAAYADTVQKLADDVERSRFEARTFRPGQANAAQQLEQIAAGMRRRAALVDAIVDLGRTFYATLTQEQKAIADRGLWLPLSLLATGVAPSGPVDAPGRGETVRSP